MQTRINQLFEQSVKCHQDAGDNLGDSLITASELMAESLLTEKKIMSCGGGSANSFSQYFCYTLLNQLERERPALPAFNLCSESALSSITENPDSSELFSNQIQALGYAGDTLLVIANAEQNASLHQAIHTAEQRQINVVLLNCNQERWWDNEPAENRVEVFSPTDSPVLAQQLHLVALQTICELIENQLFGE
ncbi:MAG: SIS domain-containing protein [Pseudomonadales bacterium]|nr:SIS domain-containing protein [Pseudomonadales bacterium]